MIYEIDISTYTVCLTTKCMQNIGKTKKTEPTDCQSVGQTVLIKPISLSEDKHFSKTVFQ